MTKCGKFEIEVNPAHDNIIVHIEAGEDGNVWLSKAEIAQVFEVFYAAVSANIRAMMKSGDLCESRHVRTIHYRNKKGQICSNDLFNLEAAIALGFRMKGYKCQLFRQWVARQLSTVNNHKQMAFIVQMCNSGIKN